MIREENKKLIKKEMRIDEVVLRYPQSADIFLKYGLHCIGCAMAGFESIEEGASVHGMNKKTISNMLKELNNQVKLYSDKFNEKKDLIRITDRAIKQVTNLMKKTGKGTKYLRIAFVEMPFGQRYGFRFEKIKKKTDVLIEKQGTFFLIDKKDVKKMKGSTLDYLSFIPGNGFKVYSKRN